jgi:hypothetical protein
VTPEPIATGLHLCHDLAVHPDSLEVSLTRIFRTFRSPLYPATAPPFWAFGAIHGPKGRGELRVAVTRLLTDEMISEARGTIEFPSPLVPVYVRLRFSNCRFPAPGAYETMMMIDRDVIAQRVFHVLVPGAEQ